MIRLVLALLALSAMVPSVRAQDLPAPQQRQPAPVRSAIVGWQQMGISLELLSSYYEGRIQELKALCGDPCKEK